MASTGQQQSDHGSDQTPRSEWVVAGLSTVIVLVAIGFLIYDAVTSPSTSPDIRVAVDSIVVGRAGFIAHFTAHNMGGLTGANVQISGVLHAADDTTVVEESRATLQFVPSASRRGGGLFFTHDPRRYRLTTRAEGYDSP